MPTEIPPEPCEMVPGDPELVPERWRRLFGMVDRVRCDLDRGLVDLVDRKHARKAGKILDEMDADDETAFMAASLRALFSDARSFAGAQPHDACQFAFAAMVCELAYTDSWKAARRLMSDA